MKFFFLLLAGLLFLSGCRKQAELSECIQSKIESFSNHSCQYGAEVKEYIFQGQTAYVFQMGYCGADLTAEVVDRNCNYLGDLGGIIGNTKINGEDFSTAIYVRTIWQR